MHYSIVCFNGRFGWVPFTNLFSTSVLLAQKDKTKDIDFDKIEKSFLCTKYTLTYEFSNDTM